MSWVAGIHRNHVVTNTNAVHVDIWLLAGMRLITLGLDTMR